MDALLRHNFNWVCHAVGSCHSTTGCRGACTSACVGTRTPAHINVPHYRF